MTDNVNRISGSAAIPGNGGGNARKKEESKWARQDSHDTVSISNEARRRCFTEDPEDEAPHGDI